MGLRGLISDYGPERDNLGSERADLVSERGLRGGSMDEKMDGQTYVWIFTPVSHRTFALWDRYPKIGM